MMKRKKFKPKDGWVLIADDDSGERTGLYICWDELFGTRKAALKFATDHGWPNGAYRAARATITAAP